VDPASVFHRDGILVVRGLLADVLADLLPRARAVQAQVRRTLPPGTRFWRGGTEPPPERICDATWGINEITRPDLFDPGLVDVLGHPGVAAVLAALVDRPRAWGLKLLWNPTWRPYDLTWHRDCLAPAEQALCAYKPAANDHVQFNAALTADRSFLVVPGSHRRALTPEECAAWGSRADLPGRIRVDLAPGDVLFMDAHALHRGSATVDADRLSLHYSVQADWVPLAPWGEPDRTAWIRSDAFLACLAPATRPCYERLRTAPPAADAMDWLRARGHGKNPPEKT
jgi:hypothetical protein